MILPIGGTTETAEFAEVLTRSGFRIAAMTFTSLSQLIGLISQYCEA